MKVIFHPGFDVGNAISNGGEDNRGDGFGRHVELRENEVHGGRLSERGEACKW